MTPTPPMQTDQEILENSIENDSTDDDDDFSKDLPFESEYYRTSTDHDDFVRPIPGPEENEIDDGEGGIDLDESFSWNQTPDCTYHIFIQLFYDSIDRLDIKLEGLKLKSTAKSNLTQEEFARQAQTKIFENIKGKNLTNDLVNGVVNYLRETFTSTYGYEDYCGISTNTITYYMKNDTQNDSNESNESNEGITDNPVEVDSSTQIEAEKEIESETENVTETEAETVPPKSETEIEAETVSPPEPERGMFNVEVTASDIIDIIDVTTEVYQPKVLKKPKLSAIIQDSINFYKALHNWNFPAPSQF